MDQRDHRSLAQQSQDDWEARRSQRTPIVLAGGSAEVVRIAARTAPELTVVLTDDTSVDLGRPEVQVTTDPAAVAATLGATSGPIRWIGLGTTDQLPAVLDAGLAARLYVTQLQVPGGGPLLDAATAGRIQLDLVSPNPC